MDDGDCRLPDIPAETIDLMTTDIPQRYFDDFEIGMTFEFGDYQLSADEIIAFGKAYDPQPYHVSRDPGPGFAMDELIASGWQTCAVTMRMLVDSFIPARTVLPAGGVDKIRWLRPVRPDDRLWMRLTIEDLTPSSSKPDRGTVKLKTETYNQNANLVMTAVIVVLFRRRIRG
jgi:acyl dehydratase